MRSLITVGLVLAGCVDDGERVATLSELQPRIEIFVGFVKPSLEVTIVYDDFLLGDCAILSDDFVARVGGVNLPIASRGEWFDASICTFPKLYTAERPQLPAAILELGDASRTIQCDFENALLPRSITPVPAGPWTFAPGQRVTVRWSPMGDLLRAEATVSFFGGRSVPAEAVSQTDDLLSFTVPATLGAGPYEIQLDTNGADYRGIDCGGVQNRMIENHQHVQAVTISP